MMIWVPLLAIVEFYLTLTTEEFFELEIEIPYFFKTKINPFGKRKPHESSI